jgi:hypothetical protein
VFWRVVATRPPPGDPRRLLDYASLRLVPFLARYDRDVAAVVFQPVRTELENHRDFAIRHSSEFLAWSLFDPRGAVARIKQLALNRGTEARSESAFNNVAESLALPSEARWRSLWRTQSGLGGVLFDRDVW